MLALEVRLFNNTFLLTWTRIFDWFIVGEMDMKVELEENHLNLKDM